MSGKDILRDGREPSPLTGPRDWFLMPPKARQVVLRQSSPLSAVSLDEAPVCLRSLADLVAPQFLALGYERGSPERFELSTGALSSVSFGLPFCHHSDRIEAQVAVFRQDNGGVISLSPGLFLAVQFQGFVQRLMSNQRNAVPTCLPHTIRADVHDCWDVAWMHRAVLALRNSCRGLSQERPSFDFETRKKEWDAMMRRTFDGYVSKGWGVQEGDGVRLTWRGAAVFTCANSWPGRGIMLRRREAEARRILTDAGVDPHWPRSELPVPLED